MPAPELETKRLLLRHWKNDDLVPFAQMNADPIVMEHFPETLSQEKSDQLVKKIQEELQQKDYGLWAVEVKKGASFIGFVGLHYTEFPAPFTPCIEIGWRLAKEHWGKGYAYEAAHRVLEYAFGTLQLPEVFSFTSTTNKRSQKLMQKLKMRHDPKENFKHPAHPEESPLCLHVLYRIENSQLPSLQTE